MEDAEELLGLATRQPVSELKPRLDELGRNLRQRGVLASWSMVAVDDSVHAIDIGAMALQGAFFRPNVLFMRMPPVGSARDDASHVIATARDIHMGVVLFSPHPSAALGRQRDVTMWVRHGGDAWNADAAFANAKS